MAADLGTARLFVSVMGSEEEKRASLQGLQSAAPFIRGRLWELLDLKTVPELTFRLDRTLERAARIDELLGRIQDEGAPDAPDDDGEPPAARDEAPGGATGRPEERSG